MISISPSIPITGFFVGAAAPAGGVVAAASFWTPVVYFVVAIELAWLAGGLAFLLWLTRRTVERRTHPQTPKRLPAQDEPPLAA